MMDGGRSSLKHAAFVALLCRLDVVNSALVTRSTVGLSTGVAMEWLRCGTRSSASAPPLLFVHGTFHGAWAWEAHWMEHFAAAGLESHAISLRGTSGTPCDAKSVKITEHVEDLKAFVDEALGGVSPILVGHSFGGASCLKYLESGGPAAGAVLLCSVPPSGNGPMVLRFLRRSLRQAWLITRGFAAKAAATDVQTCRDLFFDERTPLETVARYLPLLEADAQVGLDVGHFTRHLPSACTDSATGRATWLDAAPPTLVLGADRDGVVDREGVEETAAFLGTCARFVDLPHDVMLCNGWEAPAEVVVEWVRGIAPPAQV